MKKDYTKTDRIILLLQAISRSPSLTLTEKKVMSVLGNPSRAQWYKIIKELTQNLGERKALLIEKKDNDGNIDYQLNQSDWLTYIEGRNILDYIMSTYRELGHLFPKFEMEGFQTHSKDFDRKFYYLCKNKVKLASEERKNFLETIIHSLVGNTKMLIDYMGIEDTKAKTVDIYPLTITQYRDDLYLMAMKNELKEENIRAYKISRIEKITPLKEKFKYPLKSKWEPRQYFEKTSGIINGPHKKAIFKVYGHSKKILSEKQIFDAEIISKTKEYDEYKCSYTNIEELMGLLFIYGQDVEIISDATLKKAFREKAEKILKRN